MLQAFQIMQWPLLACLLLPGLLVYYGLHIVRREIIFVDLALAQVAALGSCLSILMGHDAHDWQNFAYSLSFTVVGAAVFTLTRTEDHRVPQEALIGIVYVVSAAAGMLLLSRSPQGDEELRRTLVGELLLIRGPELWRTFALFASIGVIHFIFRKRFLMISFDPARARKEGVSVRWWDFLFYSLFGLLVTSFVHVAGVLLVFSYLIVPAVCANFLADSLGRRMSVGWAVATLGSIIGLAGSYRFDFPTGEAIVCALGALLLLVMLGRRFGSPKAASSPRPPE